MNILSLLKANTIVAYNYITSLKIYTGCSRLTDTSISIHAHTRTHTHTHNTRAHTKDSKYGHQNYYHQKVEWIRVEGTIMDTDRCELIMVMIQ